MAHIKVVRRSMRPEEWTDLRFGWLKRYVYEEKFEIENLKVRNARQVGENEYEFYPEGWQPLKRGDMYFTPDGTAFFEADVFIPERMRGKELWFSLKTAAEIIVKCNGKYVGGVDPNRERILLTPYLDGNSALHFEMEGYNRSKPDDERNPESLSVRGCRQIFEGAYLAVINHTVLDLVYDIELLLDIAKSDSFNEDYRTFINRELNNALNLIDFDDVKTEDVANAQKYVNDVIFANDDYKGNGDVALVAHSHLDLAYYWRRIHSVQKNLRTVLIQLRLMDRYPDFKYTHTQPQTYEMLEKYYPEVFSELKEKIANGQFELVGAMYVEPDCNIPSAESLIRQCLYGQSYYREKFGKTVDNAWLPDVFGNSWVLPQILLKSGVKYFVSNKMSTWNDTNRFPHNNFLWRGIDGSEVYACVPPTHFITWNAPSSVQENWDAYQDKNTGGQTLQMFGYGDGGSGVTEEMIELMHRFSKVSAMPKTEHLGGSEYLHKNFDGNENLEKWDGELYLEMHRGTFTTKSDLKKMNRKLEYKLREAEIISTLNHLKGATYPYEEIKDCYKILLTNQFHDILPGSHIHPVFVDTMKELNEIDARLESVIGTGDKYFNSLNFKRISLTFIEDADGHSERLGVKGNWVIPNIPALSSAVIPWRTFAGDWCEIADYITTPFYKIKFNKDGSIESLFDRELKREWTKGEFNKLKLYKDNPGVYDAWDILPNYKDVEVPYKIISPLKTIEKSSECAAFEVILGTEKSTWKRIIRVFRQSRGIEVENIVDWHEKHVLAKAQFDCNVLTREAVCDLGAGFIKRETHRNTSWQQARFEVCHHKWFDMAETDGGIAIINESKYGAGFYENSATLSLLRSTIRPDIESDMGHHEFCYMIYPHPKDFVSAEINNIAYEYNVPMVKADLTCENSFGELFLQTMKMSENGKMIVIRLSEQNGKRGQIELSGKVKILNMLEDVIGEATTLNYSPFEILTVGIEI